MRAGAENPRKVKLPPLRNGLHPYAYADPSRYGTIAGQTQFVVEDAEFGFIHVYCAEPSHSCSVQSELTPYLTLSVTIGDSELDQWRVVLAAARKAAREFIVSQ